MYCRPESPRTCYMRSGALREVGAFVRFVGQDQTSSRVAPYHLAEGLRISCAAANDPVGPEVKNIANAGNGDCAGVGRDRPLLDRFVSRVENDVIDLVEREAGDLDRRIGEDQLLELDLQLVQVPLALLAKAIDGDAENALFDLAQVLDAHAWDAAKAELPSRMNPNGAINDCFVLANEDRRAEAEGADRACHLMDMGRVELANHARRQSQLFERDVHKVEVGQRVVTRSMGRR
jgi:hypothetical protein